MSQAKSLHLLGATRQDAELVTTANVALAVCFGHHVYRWVTALLKQEGRHVNEKRVYSICRSLGIKVLMKQSKRGPLCLNDGLCVLLRPAYKGHV